MSEQPLDSFVVSTDDLRPQRFLFAVPGDASGFSEPPPSVGPRIVFRPLTAKPVASPRAGLGRVSWLLGGEDDTSAAGIAWALRSSVPGKCLVADARGSDRQKEGDRAPVRVGDTGVYRGPSPAMDGLLREWLLFVGRCREAYAWTILASRGAAPSDALLRLADDAAVLTRASDASVCHASGVLRRVRQAGVRKGECLWLDAA